MELSEIYQESNFGCVADFGPKISFEICPQGGNDISCLYEQLRILKRFNPVLISLSDSSKDYPSRFSAEDMKSIRDLEFNLMPHFTCISSLKDEIGKRITEIENLGIENVFVLNGVIPEYIKQEELDFTAVEMLVDFIRQKSTLSIGVEGKIEQIPAKNGIKEDIATLKHSLDNGACVVFTSPFFDNEKFYKYCDKISKSGADIPIIPRIITVNEFLSSGINDISIPDNLKKNLEKYPNDIEKIGTDFCISQCLDLTEFGVLGLQYCIPSNFEQISVILENIL